MFKTIALATLIALNDAVKLECCPNDHCDTEEQLHDIVDEVVKVFKEDLDIKPFEAVTEEVRDEIMEPVATPMEPEAPPMVAAPPMVSSAPTVVSSAPVVPEPMPEPEVVFDSKAGLYDGAGCSGERLPININEDGSAHEMDIGAILGHGWNDRAVSVAVPPGYELDVWQHGGKGGWV